MALTLTGHVASLALKVAVSAGALGLSGHAPTVNAGLSFSIPKGSLVFKGPQQASDVPITIAARAVAFTGHAPSLLSGNVIGIAAGTITSSGQYVGCGFDGGAVGVLTLSGVAPSLAKGIPIAAGSLVVTGRTLSLVTQGELSPEDGELRLVGLAPTASTAFYLPITQGSASLSGYAPSLTVQSGPAIAPGALVLVGYAPSLVQTDNAARPSIGIRVRPRVRTILVQRP